MQYNRFIVINSKVSVVPDVKLYIFYEKISIFAEVRGFSRQTGLLFNSFIMAEVHYMSQEGLDKMKKELAEALAQRPVIAAAIAEAREKGDLSENAEYESAREAQGLLELKISNLQNMVANAKVLDNSQLSTDKVQMLNKVRVENMLAHREMEFTIVGESEADFSAGKLAATTPIAKALLGHSKGEVVEAKVPSGVLKFKILDITF